MQYHGHANGLRPAALVIAGMAALTACAGPSTPIATPTIPATAISSATQPPTMPPTATIAVVTPSEARASSTPGVTPGSSGTLDCRVLVQATRNGRHFAAGQHFDMGWKVENVGTLAWDPEDVVFTFYGGTKMYASTPTHLQQTVASGDIVLLVADLVAPKNPGKYTTTWSLKQGDKYFCPVRLMIYVP